MLAGKKILLGLTGGIAVYKSASLVRDLIKASAEVKVMMTESAQRFVGRLTFETLSENKVGVDLFGDENTSPTAHIEWARWPDIIVLSPATANTIAKIANGIADNFLTTTVLATKSQILFCPAMNVEMYKNPLVQQNIEKLASMGFHFLEPNTGELACGEVGLGRLAEPSEIVRAIRFYLNSSDELRGKKVLVTAGPTHEAIDPVRYLTNRSSGKMGYALAEEAAQRGAEVTLVSGPTQLDDPPCVNVVRIESAAQMDAEVKKRFAGSHILIMAAAVADFRPAVTEKQKIKKSAAVKALALESTEDILQSVGREKSHQFIVGFALETEHQIANAIEKMQNKNCDLIVLNDPLETGAGFNVDTNRVTIIDGKKQPQTLPLMKKQHVAQKILDAIQAGMAKDE